MKYLCLLISGLFIFLSGCQEHNQTQSLVVQPYFNNEKIGCDQTFTLNEQSWQITQLQFYLANIEVKNRQGDWHTLPLTVNGFQSSNVALLGNNCQQVGLQSNWRLQFEKSFDLNNYTNVRFTLGVPFALNHLNPLQQESPLNVPSMFWVWRSGHKFLRLELISKEQQSWLFHLGSTGCKAASPVRAPTQPCINPNQAVIEMPLPVDNIIRFNLAALLQGLDISENASCQSEPDNHFCQILFERIGLTNKQLLFGVNLGN